MKGRLAVELNETIRRDNPYVFGMLSELGRELFFPKGILTQSAEADLHENILAIKLDGATKEDYVWGLRVGFITFGIPAAGLGTYQALTVAD